MSGEPQPGIEPGIEVAGVTKLYGTVRALDEIDLRLGPGVTGLLGPNGSGKSTLLKLVSGQLRPDTGTVRVGGLDPFAQPEVFRSLGLCPEQDKFYEEQTGESFVTALTRLHGYGAREARERARAALTRVGMAEHMGKRIQAMSRGMRQRTKIAQAIAHDPPIVLLDEPLTGTDPIGRADLIALVRELGQQGRCVVVSSHVLHEVEAMTHQVVMVRYGRLRATGDIARLRALLDDRPYRFRVEVARPRALAAALVVLPHVRAAEVVDATTLELTTTDLAALCRALPREAAALGLVIDRLGSPDADLESLYRYLIERPGGPT
ncbi:MAG: ABC transporter ATP-binding protein [Myxococcales bacterium]|nr:ABC transporter ATP-binding protein [Myxococcales bacterium]MCB9715626.1 ABC transporter ATP-binding protein [Myxococcales bacterium]